MYIPFFRGKQEEQFAVLETDISIYQNPQKVLPLFEPIRHSSAAMNRYVRMSNEGREFIFIMNPKARTSPTQAEVEHAFIHHQLHQQPNVKIGILIDHQTTDAEVQHFMQLHPNLSKVAVHLGAFHNPGLFAQYQGQLEWNIFREGNVTQAYINQITHGSLKAILSDGFNRQPRNIDYGGTELFNDLPSTYQQRGFDGFGDYLTIGETYTPGGGPANAVALHLTHTDANGDVQTTHFVSTNNQGVVDTAAQYFNALGQLVNFHNNNPVLVTTGLNGFIDSHNNQSYHALGRPKRNSMMHHMELINSLI